jgi:hypothetical protein
VNKAQHGAQSTATPRIPDTMASKAGKGKQGGRSRTDYDEKEGIEFTLEGDVEVASTFEELGLKEDLLRGIYAYGFERPSAVQQRAIKPIISGRDVIAQSQSGTGELSTSLCAGDITALSVSR